MNNEQLASLIEVVRKGPPLVIGFDRDGDLQKAFNKGWNAAKDEVWAQLKVLGIDDQGTSERAEPAPALWARAFGREYFDSLERKEIAIVGLCLVLNGRLMKTAT